MFPYTFPLPLAVASAVAPVLYSVNNNLPTGTTATAVGLRTDGLLFTVTRACQLVSYGYFLPTGGDTAGADYTGNLWTTVGGADSALVAGSTVNGSGLWTEQQVNYFPVTPVPLVPGNFYVAGVTGNQPTELQFVHNYWGAGQPGAGGFTAGPVTVPDATVAPSGFQQANVSAASYPNASTQSWYGVAIQVLG